MTNRAGKSEREARNRSKRGLTYGTLRDGTLLKALKLGRRKGYRLVNSTRLDCNFTVHGLPRRYVEAKYVDAMPAVQVADAERQERNA